MYRAIMSDQTPNLYLLRYNLPEWRVESVLLIPHFAFSLSFIAKRNALSPTARRRGHVGCYFVLDRIPPDAKIPVVHGGEIVPPAEVRKAYQKVRPLEKLNIEKRGWTLDVLNVVRALKKNEFALSEVYDHADQLAELHPQNHHIDEKIRQQLQELRKLGFLAFDSPGHYTLR